jgi:ATP-dependent exoDNAse (exonuclease V) alpha subunit
VTEICDLLSLLKRVPYNKIPNVQVYGRLVRKLCDSESTYEGTGISDGSVIAELELFALKFLGVDYVTQYTGDGNQDHMYFCRGSLAVCVRNRGFNKYLNDYWAFTGRLSQPKGEPEVVNLFNFRKCVDGNWSIHPLSPEDIEAYDWSPTFQNYIVQSIEANAIRQPSSILTLPSCQAIGKGKEDAESVAPVEETPIQSVEDTLLTGDINPAKSEVASTAVSEPVPTTESNTDIHVAPKDIADDTLPKDVLRLKIDSSFNLDKIKSLSFKSTRMEISEMSPNYSRLENLCSNLVERQEDYLQKFSERYPYDGSVITENVETLLLNLIKYWNMKPNGLTRTGKTIVNEYMNRADADINEDYMGSTVGKFLLSLGNMLLQSTLGVAVLPCTSEAQETADFLFGTPEYTYAGLLAVIIGVDVQKMMSVASRCVGLRISFSTLLNSNPYSLVLISNILSFSDIEKIALCLGKATLPKVKRGKNVALLYNHMMTCTGGDTIYSKHDLLRTGLGVQITKREYMQVKAGQSTVPKPKQDELVAYVNSALKITDWVYSPLGWSRQGFGYCQSMSANDLGTTVLDVTASGIGTEIGVGDDSWVCSTVHLKKELFVYEKAYILGQRRMNFRKEDITKYINMFEDMKGFKLEDRQREAVYLVLTGMAVITGGAGSGKTTISECIVYVLRHINRRIRIRFGAPTGKASKRLQEVVGEPTKTMHSMFGLSAGTKDLFEEIKDSDESSSEPDVYILDENAMSSLDLLYSVFKRVTKAQIFLLGDIDQLPPIGKGLPFRTLLQFLPYVALNVSKRSAEGSMVTKNSDIIRNHSSVEDWKDIESDGNCRLIECADESITDVINDICKWHLGISKVKPEGAADGLFNPDDIQVVAPVKTDKYSWGTSRMNPVLQNTFCPLQYGQSFVHGIGDNVIANYRIGDRVINTSNNYSMVHYGSWKNGVCEMLPDGLGITNGDVGTIVGVLQSETCTIKTTELTIDTNHEPRVDKAWRGNNKYFVVVKFYDYESGADYFLLYRCTLNRSASTDLEMVFYGEDLSSIELAYALTTHKMQGSQAKLIIVALGSMRNSSFLNRNMFYTMVSRGEDLVYVIGSVSNDRSSAMSIARTILASDKTVTVADVALLS